MLQRLAKASAQTQASSSLQDHGVFAVIHKLQTADSIHVDDRRAVNAAERSRLQLLLEHSEAATQQVRVRTDVQAGVVVRSLDPIDIGKVHERDLPCALNNERLGTSWTALPMMG